MQMKKMRLDFKNNFNQDDDFPDYMSSSIIHKIENELDQDFGTDNLKI